MKITTSVKLGKRVI